MKILNIDQYANTNRQLSIGGNIYPVEEPTVQQFIDNLKAAEDLEKQGGDPDAKLSLSESFEQAVKTITQAVPTVPVALVRSLKLPAMTAVLQFIRGELDPDVVAPAAEGTDSEKKQD